MGLADICRKQPISQLLVHLRHRGITTRHLAFGTGILVFLWTSYYTFFARRADLVIPDHVDLGKQLIANEWHNRAEQVKAAFVHTYRGYEEHAWGYDEMKPVSNTSQNNFNSWGVTIIDSLDTMHIMGLHDDFQRALAFVENATFDVPRYYYAPFFETTIRYLGGLLAGYAVSGEPILLARADDLGHLLAPAFNTQSKFPAFGVSTTAGTNRGSEFGSLAEIATCQLEFMYLAHATGKKEYFDLADGVNQNLYKADLTTLGGMLPTRWSTKTGKPADASLSVGAMADSAHEYLLKQYLMTAKTDKRSLELYIQATTQILTQLFYISPTRNLVYVTDTLTHNFVPTHKLEHLSCFLPGLLALGAHTLPLDNLASMGINFDDLARGLSGESKLGYAKLKGYNLKDVHMWAAESLAQTCYMTYADQPSGMGPDEVVMYTSAERGYQHGAQKSGGGEKWIDALVKWKESGSRTIPPGLAMREPVIYTTKDRMDAGQNKPLRDYYVKRTVYLLRPETLESLYLLWRITGDSRWREYGWSIFEALEREAKTASGYTSLSNVQSSPAAVMNELPSYFLAETLKYLYLLFTEEDLIPLNKYVFSTEGHPFRIFEWTAQQKIEWGIL